MDSPQRDELRVRLSLLLEGRIAPEEREELESWMRSDPEVLAYCQEYFFVWAGLHQLCSVHADLLEPEESCLDCEVSGGHHGSPRLWLTSAAALLLLVLGLWWMLHGPSEPEIPEATVPLVATLEAGDNLIWARDWQGEPNDQMAAGQWHLLQGVAQIRVGDAARVLVQGPSVFRLDNLQQMTLDWGKLTARILPDSTGFTVVAGAARIVDQGTEFGILAQPFGLNEIHVFDGKVEVSGHPSGGLASLLKAGQAAIVDVQGHYRPSGAAQPRRFLRQLPEPGVVACAGVRLDLADMVGAGNGLGVGEIDRGLDPCGGQVVRPSSTRIKDLSCSFKVLPYVDYIDGVFVANRLSGPPVVDSDGDVFKECPVTDSDYYEGIFNGVKLSLAGSLEFHQGSLDGQVYGTREFPALNIHANAGITFDLDSIRRDYPGVEIDRFTAIGGISDTVLPYLLSDDMTDIWVLIDGKVVYYHRFTASGDHHDDMDIEIQAADRFLSLVATSDGDSAFSWSFLAEPCLELVPDF